MKKITLLIFFFAAVIGVKAQDDCATAMAVDIDVVYTVDQMDGTEIPLPLCASVHGSANVDFGEWYTYTPSEDISLTITTDLPENSGLDTRFHVYIGSCGVDNLMCVGGDDDSGSGYLSVDTINVSQGVTYYIAFDDRWSEAGFNFTLMEAIPPPPGELAFTQDGSISMSGSSFAVVDMNNDGLDDLVGASSSTISLNHQTVGGFNPVSIDAAASYGPSWSIAAGDIDGNGFNDLLYGAGSGVSFMSANADGTSYSQSHVTTSYVFSQRSNFVDINNDGNLDAFVCHDVAPNVYFINDGAGGLDYYQGASAVVDNGLGTHPNGGNYGTVWIDYDNDGDMDMFIAKCRGGDVTHKINELWRNEGPRLDNEQNPIPGTVRFVNVAPNTGVNLADPVQTWSSAWADYDNDGDMDVYVGASSGSDGSHKFMVNDGTGNFSDETATANVDGAPFGIENAPADFNNDGYVDILSNGRILLNNGDNSFTLFNTNMPPSGAIGDVNNDGFLDVFNGGLYTNNGGNGNNWIRVQTVGTTSNYNGIGARLEIETATGTQIREIRSGEGFEYMSSLFAHFGIGTDTEIISLTIIWPSGIEDVIFSPAINETLTAIEGDNPLSVEDTLFQDLIIYPNPTKGVLNINTAIRLENATYSVYTVTGKRILHSKLKTETINVSKLNTGTYLLRILVDGKHKTQKFIKE